MGSNFVVRLVYKGCKAAITLLQRALESQFKDCFIHKPGARLFLASLKIVLVMHSNMDDYYSLVFEYHLC